MNIRINPRIKRFDKALRGAFIEKAVAENKMIVRAAMIFIIIAELINIIRVLFLSNSGLGTFNNRVYFTFYTVYFAGAVLVLALDLFARLSSRGSYALYTVAAVSALLWHTLFDMYDIYASDVRGYFNIIIAMFIICSHNKVEQRDNPLSVPIRTWVGSAFFVLPVIGMIIVVEEYLFPTSFWTISTGRRPR